MKTINAAKAFEVIVARKQSDLPNAIAVNVLVKVPQGVSVVEDDIADHWYTQAHLASGGLGSPEYARSVRAQADAAFVYARDAMGDYERLEAAAQEAESAASLDPVAPASERLALPADEAEAKVAKPRRAPKAKDDVKAAVAEPPAGAGSEAAPAEAAEPVAAPGADSVAAAAVIEPVIEPAAPAADAVQEQPAPEAAAQEADPPAPEAAAEQPDA